MFRRWCFIDSESYVAFSVKRFLSLFLFLFSIIYAPEVVANEILIQTGFEEFSVGKLPKDWEVRGDGFEVTNKSAKLGRNSLAILSGANDDYVGTAIETDNPIISVEFWVYIESGGRSFNFKIATSENIANNNACVYINWDADKVRCFDGAAWVPIDDFKTGEWKYVRVVANVDKSEFDFYVGEDRNRTLADRGIKNLPFRNQAEGLVTKWVTFHVYSIAAAGYIDDLLIYEGDEPANLAVDAAGKITTTWGHLKENSGY